MPRINLLPWREEQRSRRKREFGVAAAVAVVLGLAVVYGCVMFWDGLIEHQNERNRVLRAEISQLDRQIEEIRNLEGQKERLIARMEIIDQLQRSRPEIVHVFDELVQQLPDGVYFTAIQQSGNRIELRGNAESSTRVSALMRQLDSSPWFTNPNLQVVETSRTGATRRASFTVTVQQVSATEREEG